MVKRLKGDTLQLIKIKGSGSFMIQQRSNKKMNVLWITSTYPTDEQPGAGVFHETQVQALAKLGVEVTVICPVPRNPAMLRSVKTIPTPRRYSICLQTKGNRCLSSAVYGTPWSA
jgi:hypothetical protein